METDSQHCSPEMLQKAHAAGLHVAERAGETIVDDQEGTHHVPTVDEIRGNARERLLVEMSA